MELSQKPTFDLYVDFGKGLSLCVLYVTPGTVLGYPPHKKKCYTQSQNLLRTISPPKGAIFDPWPSPLLFFFFEALVDCLLFLWFYFLFLFLIFKRNNFAIVFSILFVFFQFFFLQTSETKQFDQKL